MNDPVDGLPAPRRQLALATICLGVLLSSLDGAIANLALPAIQRDFGSTASATVWVATAYQLAVVVSILPLAAAGERLGFRRVYWVGMAAFTLASLGCGLAPNLPLLVAVRALQGLGGGAMIGVSMALVRFSTPRAGLGKALALYALTAGVGLSAGPPLAAAILGLGSWPWLFEVNVPMGLVALAIGARVLPDSPRSPRRLDLGAALLNALALGLVIVGVDGLGDRGRAGLALAMIGAGLLAAAVLIRFQLKRPAPLVPVDLLRRPVVALSAATSVSAYAAMSCAFVAAPFFFLHALGLGQVATGLLIAPFPLMIVLVAPVSGRLADRYPAGYLAGAGLLVMAAALALLAALPAHASNLDVAWRMALAGAGFGFFQAPNNRTLMLAAPPERSGAASALVALARVLGQAAGSASAAVALGLFATDGSWVALWTAAAFAGLGAGLSLLRLRVG